MALIFTIMTQPIKNAAQDAVTFEVDVTDDMDGLQMFGVVVSAEFDWFDNKNKFLINVHSYLTNMIAIERNKSAKRNKVDNGMIIINNNRNVPIDESQIDFGGQP